jgi:hypothetical protein
MQDLQEVEHSMNTVLFKKLRFLCERILGRTFCFVSLFNSNNMQKILNNSKMDFITNELGVNHNEYYANYS